MSFRRPRITCSGSCFRLGLLLHGTSVVGFCSPQAEDPGWAIGDQIVEVNGQRVATFDEFLECFLAEQEHGFPINFGVLRREVLEDAGGKAESALNGFFSNTNIGDLAGQLERKFGTAPLSRRPPTPLSSAASRLHDEEVLRRDDSVTENPYIQALRQRRDELKCSADRWLLEDGAEPLAARLATRRSDALALLTLPSLEEPWRDIGGASPTAQAVPVEPAKSAPSAAPSPVSVALVGCIINSRPHCGGSNGVSCMTSFNVQPTPRPDLDTDVQAWAVPEVLSEKAGSAHFAVLLQPRK